MISHFGELKKKEESNQNHKNSLRKKLKNIKESYIGYGSKSSKEYNFPKLSEKELQFFKLEWKRKKEIEKRNTVLIILVAIITGITIAFYLRFFL
ncbi:hypothetical protein [Polaribacter vadi]|uniref:hypothetical protein n=1 Tax=Polaribacter vadi TaxID=1774273 RepID=UPI0030EE3AC3|tara:strand:- start:14821 stop:15105 length:285 start_codon:yes stop_codon:yes gene_type:complete